MAAKLVKTNSPGIYRRHAKDCQRRLRCECPYVVVHDGKTATYATLDEAREGKRLAQRQQKLSKGHAQGLHRDESRDECPACEHERLEREQHRLTFHVYAREVVERYHGTGRRGYREETRDEDRRLLEHYALRYFRADLVLAEVRPKQIADFVGWLVKQPSNRGGTLSDSSVRNALKPVRFVLATARREGLIEHNPSADAVIPHRPQIAEDEDDVRPFPTIKLEDETGDKETVETMELVVSLLPPEHRDLFELLAATGQRRSEILALAGKHLALDGDQPYVKIRQRLRRRKGHGLLVGPLKSRHARRDLPIPPDLARRLSSRRTAPNAPVFPSKVATWLDPDNVAERVLAPACAAAGVEWAGFHTFRHTVASRLFAEGRSVVAVQRWLGHHSPSFTLDTYVHLLSEDLGTPLIPRPNAPKVALLGSRKGQANVLK